MQEGHEGPAPRQPDRRLGGRVAAADHRDARGAAALGLGRPGRVEDADALVVLEALDREAAVLGAGRQHDRAGRDLVPVAGADDVAIGAGLERDGLVGSRGAAAELPGLGDGAAGELRPADPGREAEVVLDPPGRAGLAAEHRALEHQRLEPLRGPVHRGSEAGGPAAHDQQVDLLLLSPARGRSRGLGRSRRWRDCEGRRRREGEPAAAGPAPAPRRSPRPRDPPSARGRASCAAAGSASAHSTTRRVSSEERGPTISTPIPSRRCRVSRLLMKVESRRSASGPSSVRSGRSFARSTAM